MLAKLNCLLALLLGANQLLNSGFSSRWHCPFRLDHTVSSWFFIFCQIIDYSLLTVGWLGVCHPVSQVCILCLLFLLALPLVSLMYCISLNRTHWVSPAQSLTLLLTTPLSRKLSIICWLTLPEPLLDRHCQVPGLEHSATQMWFLSL